MNNQLLTLRRLPAHGPGCSVEIFPVDGACAIDVECFEHLGVDVFTLQLVNQLSVLGLLSSESTKVGVLALELCILSQLLLIGCEVVWSWWWASSSTIVSGMFLFLLLEGSLVFLSTHRIFSAILIGLSTFGAFTTLKSLFSTSLGSFISLIRWRLMLSTFSSSFMHLFCLII